MPPLRTDRPPRFDIVPYRDAHASAFRALNREWIEQYFTMEPQDWAVLDDPRTKILARGGAIFCALCEGEVVGVAAALVDTADRVELGKMAVSSAHQGLGIGAALGQAVIAHARASGASLLFLLSNDRLGPALRLYERLGFQRRPLADGRGYQRANVYMELTLHPAGAVGGLDSGRHQ
jgi:GNAT superfamily N-acetyltransferase